MMKIVFDSLGNSSNSSRKRVFRHVLEKYFYFIIIMMYSFLRQICVYCLYEVNAENIPENIYVRIRLHL